MYRVERWKRPRIVLSMSFLCRSLWEPVKARAGSTQRHPLIPRPTSYTSPNYARPIEMSIDKTNSFAIPDELAGDVEHLAVHGQMQKVF